MTVIVVPVRNEEKDLKQFLEGLPSTAHVIAVDGGSTDRSREIAWNTDLVHCLDSQGSTYGDAVLTGMREALQVQGVSTIVVMDVGSHSYSDIEPWLPMGGTDLLAGKRLHEKKPFVRRVLSMMAQALCRTVVSDPSNGFRAYKPWVAQEIVDKYQRTYIPSYAFNMAIALDPSAVHGRWRVREFPINYKAGKSGLNFKEACKVALWRIGWYR